MGECPSRSDQRIHTFIAVNDMRTKMSSIAVYDSTVSVRPHRDILRCWWLRGISQHIVRSRASLLSSTTHTKSNSLEEHFRSLFLTEILRPETSTSNGYTHSVLGSVLFAYCKLSCSQRATLQGNVIYLPAGELFVLSCLRQQCESVCRHDAVSEAHFGVE